MNHFKLKQALKKRNVDSDKKMTQKELASKLFKDHNIKTALYHVNMASNGHAFGRFTPDKIVELCKLLKCDPNYLFNYKSEKTNK